MERWAVHPCYEIVPIEAVVAVKCMVGRDVDRIGGNRDRARKQHLLPAGHGLSREGGGRQQGAATRPEVGYMSTSIGARLVESDTGYTPVQIRLEFHPQLHRTVWPCIH